MVILFWTDWFLPSIGGVEVFASKLLPDLVRRGHEVTVIAGHHQDGLPDNVEWDGVRVRRFPFHQVLLKGDAGRTFDLMRAVAGMKRSIRPDIVHLNTVGSSVFFHLETASRCPSPTLLTMHSPVPDDADRQDTLGGRTIRESAWVNCNSHAVHADLTGLVPAVRNRSSVTYYGLDPPELKPTKRPDEPIILGYGRLVRDKGFDLALRALHRVREQVPNARLMLVGGGPARPELEELAAELGLSVAVDFVGAVAPDCVPGLLNRASIVVVPSRWNEPFGLVALEAALMERPVVAARVGGLPEVVEDGTTGLVVGAEDSAALADAMISLLTDRKMSDEMGRAARQRAEAHFSWVRCVDAYEALYERTLHLGRS